MTDAVMAEIGEVVALGHSGDTATARQRFADLWDEVDDPFHRCALAHYAADVQADPSDELRWDLRALAAADAVPDRTAVAAFYPSLHLNLADVHRRLGDVEQACRHLEQARATVDALPDDGYGRMIRGGVDRCGARTVRALPRNPAHTCRGEFTGRRNDPSPPVPPA
jgi:tetratricopeptide (TPR) repeat protein